MSNPIIKVSDVAFPRFQGPDLDVMETYLTNFGMVRSARTEDALYMRGTDPDHHVHVTHRGEIKFIGLTFNATLADLETLSQATGAPIQPCTDPGGGSVVRLTDPDGNQVDVLANAQQLPTLEVRKHAAYTMVNLGHVQLNCNELNLALRKSSDSAMVSSRQPRLHASQRGTPTRLDFSVRTTCTSKIPNNPSVDSCAAIAARLRPIITRYSFWKLAKRVLAIARGKLPTSMTSWPDANRYLLRALVTIGESVATFWADRSLTIGKTHSASRLNTGPIVICSLRQLR